MLGQVKVSLHRSGSWSYGLTSQAAAKESGTAALAKLGQQGRHFAIWQRPPEFFSGYTMAFRIIVPTSCLKKFVTQDKKLSWIPVPSDDKVTLIELIMTGAKATVTGWPGANEMGAEKIGSLVLPSQETLWLIWRTEDISAQLSADVVRWRREMSEAISDQPSRTSRRACIFGDAEDGTRCLIDLDIPDV